MAYVVNELAASIDYFAYDAENGTLLPVGSIDMLPRNYHPEEWTSNFGRWAADICVHPSGRFLYATNRLFDTIVRYDLDLQNGTPSKPVWFPTEGRTPRSMSLTPDGNVLIVAHMHSHDITSYIIEENGDPTPTGFKMYVPYASCVKTINNVNQVMIPQWEAE